jgi:hypothetical protein
MGYNLSKNIKICQSYGKSPKTSRNFDKLLIWPYVWQIFIFLDQLIALSTEYKIIFLALYSKGLELANVKISDFEGPFHLALPKLLVVSSPPLSFDQVGCGEPQFPGANLHCSARPLVQDLRNLWRRKLHKEMCHK